METHLSQQPDQSSSSQRQYTTVGSVWHPQSTPLQPPARRGRALRSSVANPMLEPYPEDPFNTFGAAHPYSHSHYYSPLQQNFDRAVSPIQSTRLLSPDHFMHPDHPTHFDNIPSSGSPGPKRITEFGGQYSATPPIGMPQQISPAIPRLPMPGNTVATPGIHGQVNNHYDNEGNNHEHEDVEEEEDINMTLNNMSTKTLTNLASYPNPMREAAQRVLTRARQVPSAPHHQVSDSISHQNSGLNFPPGLGPRTIRSDPVGAESLFQSDKFDSRNPDQLLGHPHPGVTTAAARGRDSYPAVLPKGLGAPQPLTAGPPGQRHFQPSAFNGAPNALQKGFEKPREFDNFADDLTHHQPLSSFQPQRHAQSTPRQPTPSYKSEALSIRPVAPVMNKDTNSNIKMVDTLTYEEAKRFFPKGLPPDFNFDTKPVDDNWAEKCMKEEEEKGKGGRQKLLWQQTAEFQANHKSRLDHDFYNGNYMIYKNLRTAVHEKNNRDVVRTIGSESQEPRELPKPRLETEFDGRFISVENANAIPTHEHAEPLLSVLYQSLDRNTKLSSPEKSSPSSGPH
ncbi:hypothetical protein F5Y11DRAFT_365692 [Daldinia sp. FL1419]|nr:hypothetical protein F5Y11DRAFT_365692 [Daldinia sp. FL1419]